MPALATTSLLHGLHTTSHTTKVAFSHTTSDVGVKWGSASDMRPPFGVGWSNDRHHGHAGNMHSANMLPSSMATVPSGSSVPGTALLYHGPPTNVPVPTMISPGLNGYQPEAAEAYVTALFTSLEKLSQHLTKWDGQETKHRVEVLRRVVHSQDLAVDFIGTLGTRPATKSNSCTSSLFDIVLCIIQDLEDAERYIRASEQRQAQDTGTHLRTLTEHLLFYCGSSTGSPPHSTSECSSSEGPASTVGPPLSSVPPSSPSAPASSSATASSSCTSSNSAPAQTVVPYPTTISSSASASSSCTSSNSAPASIAKPSATGVSPSSVVSSSSGAPASSSAPGYNIATASNTTPGSHSAPSPNAKLPSSSGSPSGTAPTPSSTYPADSKTKDLPTVVTASSSSSSSNKSSSVSAPASSVQTFGGINQ